MQNTDRGGKEIDTLPIADAKGFSERFRIILLYIAIPVAVLVAFEPVRHNKFLAYDDGIYITENSHVQKGLSLDSIAWAFKTGHTGNWHPITWLSYMLDCELFGVSAFWEHSENVLIHIFNSLLLFSIFRKSTRAVWPSWFVAMIFAVHPLHVESVAWASERKDVLSGLFWMLTMAAYIRYVNRPKILRYILTLTAFGIGLMAKPMLVTLPFILLMMDYWPLKRLNFKYEEKGRKKYNDGPGFYRLIAEKLVFFALALASSVVTFLVQRAGGAMRPMKQIPLVYRTGNAIVSYTGYIMRMFLPINMAVFYPHPRANLPLWLPLLCLVVLGVISGLALYFGRQHRYLITGWFWYLLTLVPVIGLVQVGKQAMADRYMYLPMIGPLIIVAWAIYEPVKKSQYFRKGLWIATWVVIVVLILITRNQVRYWRDNLTLFGHAIEVTKNNSVAHYNIANALQHQGQFEQAVYHYEQALRIDPEDLRAMNNLGATRLKQGKTDEALKCFERALKLDNHYVDALGNLGLAFREKGDTDAAMETWQKVLRLEPGHPDAHFNIAVTMFRSSRYDLAIKHFNKALEKKKDWLEVYNYLGLAYEAMGRFNLAINTYNSALELSPDNTTIESNLALTLKTSGKASQAAEIWHRILSREPENLTAHYELAQILEEEKELDKALEHFNKVLQLKPDWSEIHHRIANIYYMKNDLATAVQHLHEAVTLNSNSVGAMNDLAWILATTQNPDIRNPPEAIELAHSACEQTNNEDPAILDTLATAYAAAGRFDDAIKTAELALALASEKNEMELINDINEHLSLFKSGRVYYEKDNQSGDRTR